jgi:hypothetical protein
VTVVKKPKTHCGHGHDLAVLGRDAQGHCRACQHENQRRYSDANRDKIRASNRERARASYQAAPEVGREKARSWRAGNPETARAVSQKWHAANPEKKHAAGLKHRESVRQACFDYYGGGKCEVCGVTEDLHLHHTLGGGNEHRLSVLGRRAAGDAFYQHLVREGFPDDPPLRVLCEEHHAEADKLLRSGG